MVREEDVEEAEVEVEVVIMTIVMMMRGPDNHSRRRDHLKMSKKLRI